MIALHRLRAIDSRRRTTTRYAVALAVTAGLFAAGGCGDSDDERDANAPDNAPAAETTTNPAALAPATGPLTIEAVEECLSDAGASIQSSEPIEGTMGYIFAILPGGTAFAITISDDPGEIDRAQEAYSEAPSDGPAETPEVVKVDERAVLQLLTSETTGSIEGEDRSIALRCAGQD